MALQADRNVKFTDISYFVNAISGPSTTRMEAGGVLCASTSTPASGAAMDSSAAVAEYATNPSGRVPIGILLNDFVNIDLSRQQLNQYKDEQQIGNKATIMRQGYVVTNMIDSTSATGTIPSVAYAGSSGLLTQSVVSGYPIVGQFISRKDADGYAKVLVNLP
jgi:hypothetical protein